MDMNDRIVVEGFPDYSAELEQWRGRAALHFSDHYAGFVEKNETARYLLKKHESWILHCTGPWGDTDFMALRCLIFPDMTKTCEEAPPHMSASVNLCSRDEAQRKRDELHRALPEAEYVVLDWGEDKAFIYSRAAYFLFLEFRPGLWQGLVHQFALYYGDLMPDMSDLGKSEPFERAMVLSLRAYDPAVRVNFAIRNVLPPGSILTLWNVIGFFFQSDLCEVLKVALWEVIGCPCVNLSTLDDREFTQRFVQEWEYLKCFSGIVHDFSVHPRFLDRDMIRYANLPPRRRREAIVNEMINYVALRICPTYYLTINHVHPGLFRRWANLLQEMMEPRVQGVVRQLEERAERGLASGEAEKLASEMRGDIIRWTALDYWPWYHRDTALKGRPFWYIQPFANWGSMVEIGKYPAKGEPKDTDATFPERHRLGWVRPSAFLRSRLRGKYLGDSRRRGEPLSPSLMEEERAEGPPAR